MVYAVCNVYSGRHPMKRPAVLRRPARPRSRRLLRDLAYDRIKAWVLTGEFLPEQFLGEQTLAERLGVSRSPVREALANLQRDGLVDLVAHRGAFIRWPSPGDVEERFDIRIAIETLALRRAFPKLTGEVLQPLLDRVRRQRESVATASYRDIEQLSIDVHMAVLEAAGNQRIIALTHQLREQVYIASTLYRNADGTVNVGRVRQVQDDHEAMLVALLARDLDGALRALETHLVRTKEMVIEAVQERAWG
jgi:DNA-binding GntR family transcriptional regulator